MIINIEGLCPNVILNGTDESFEGWITVSNNSGGNESFSITIRDEKDKEIVLIDLAEDAIVQLLKAIQTVVKFNKKTMAIHDKYIEEKR